MKFQSAQANLSGNRDINQDRYEILAGAQGALMVLADGMGGRPCGEIAAQLVIDVACSLYREAGEFVEDERAFLDSVIYHAHCSILELAGEEDIERAPGTTAVLALLQGDKIHWAHVGDSRFYLLRDGKIVTRTRDHSQVELLYHQGKITREQQRDHPGQNRITRCVGWQDELPRVEHGTTLMLESDDIVMLCSDGVWAPLSDIEIVEQMGIKELPIGRLTARLVSMAERRSYPRSDNVSLATLQLGVIERDSSEERIDTISKGLDDDLERVLQSVIE